MHHCIIPNGARLAENPPESSPSGLHAPFGRESLSVSFGHHAHQQHVQETKGHPVYDDALSSHITFPTTRRFALSCLILLIKLQSLGFRQAA